MKKRYIHQDGSGWESKDHPSSFETNFPPSPTMSISSCYDDLQELDYASWQLQQQHSYGSNMLVQMRGGPKTSFNQGQLAGFAQVIIILC